MELEFFLNDIDYVTEGNTIAVRLFGLTKDKKIVVAIDRKFRPYIYIQAEDCGKFIKLLEEKKLDGIAGLKIEKKEFEVIKVEIKHPSNKGDIEREASRISGFIAVLENDIETAVRYLMDKSLAPLGLVNVIGSEIPNVEYRADIVLELDEIKQKEEFLDAPRYLVFDIEVYETEIEPNAKKDKITMISYCMDDGKKGVFSIKPCRDAQEAFSYFKTEENMLKEFAELVKKEKIDIISGYNTEIFDFPFIKERCKLYGIKLDFGYDKSPLNVYKREDIVRSSIKGLMHVDLYQFISRILGMNMKTETFSLNDVANELLNEGKIDIKWYEMKGMWERGKIGELAEYSLKDSVLTARLFDKIYPLMLEMSRLTCLTLSKVSRGSYSLFVEHYLMRKAFSSGIIINRKPAYDGSFERHERTFEGGFVFEPKPGLYDNIAFVDFRSLYPTIIVSHNISPETINDGKEIGFIPRVLKELIEKRKAIKQKVKELDKNDKNYHMLKARDSSLKTILNATYGYLGFENSRWYSIECAKKVTELGRMYIKDSMKKAEDFGFFVIYGDTDSLALSLGEKSREDVMKFLNKINKELPGIMELELENFYTRGIFVSKKGDTRGAKKKYALLDENNNIVIKGLEFVRRDWAGIAKKTQQKVLEIVLKQKDTKRAVAITAETIKDIKAHKVSLDEVAVYTQIRRKLEDYKSRGPHVIAAVKAKEAGYTIAPGMLIRYVVTIGKGSISSRSIIFEEAKNKKMDYDPEYYINNQVIPAIKSIFGVLDIDIETAINPQQKKLFSD